jgi:restriction system protein
MQIDHVVVSPYGVFVIETKAMDGWIFGSEKQP